MLRIIASSFEFFFFPEVFFVRKSFSKYLFIFSLPGLEHGTAWWNRVTLATKVKEAWWVGGSGRWSKNRTQVELKNRAKRIVAEVFSASQRSCPGHWPAAIQKGRDSPFESGPARAVPSQVRPTPSATSMPQPQSRELKLVRAQADHALWQGATFR